MNDQFSIDTPEQIELHYDLAGVGSRFCAALVDSSLIGGVMSVGWLVIAGALSLNTFDETIRSWLTAIAGLITFAALWGYYIIFDLVSSGQSPGKRLLKLRVIKDNGYPIGFADSAIRNLVRIVDFLPAFYSIGVIVMLLDKKWRRLGDFAAGTLVVREHADQQPSSLIPHVAEKRDLAYQEKIQLHFVTEMELSTIREYLSRRRTLSRGRRAELARTIGAPIAQKMNINDSINYDLLLEEIFALSNARQGGT